MTTGRLGLGARILIGIVAGTVLGAAIGERVAVLQPAGDLFVRLLVLAVVPLVFFNLLAGLTAVTDLRLLGRLTARFVVYFFTTKVAALLLGIAAMEVFKPGVGMTLRVPVAEPVGAPPSVVQVLIDLIPTNFVRAFAEGNVAQVVVLAMLVGIATLLLGDEPRERFTAAFNDLARLLRKVVDLVLIAAPLGIGVLMAVTVGRYGTQLFGPVATFIGGVTAAHLAMIVLYMILLWVFSGLRPARFLKETGAVWGTTVATTSSLASLSVALEAAEKLRLPRSVYAFTLPLGVQINKDGTAILLVSVVLFTAQAIGMTLTSAELFAVALLGLLLSAGSGGIPGGGFVVALIMVEAFHMPLELAGIVGGIYRLVDMGNTTVNVMGNMVGSILVAQFGGAGGWSSSRRGTGPMTVAGRASIVWFAMLTVAGCEAPIARKCHACSMNWSSTWWSMANATIAWFISRLSSNNPIGH
jgi:Na+/H+-dicarboxylate symporter